MAYTKTVWVDGSAPAISAANLNNIEQGVYDSVRQDGTTAMSAQLVTIAGSATTPAIAPTGDSNNGIFFPAADTIALSTAGSERVRVNSSGQVGIGASPSVPLDVQAAQGAIKLASTTGTNSTYLKVDNTGGTLTLGLDNSTGSSQFGVGNYAGGLWHSGNYNLTFGTNGSCRMAITGAGNVGIGTTSPSEKLHVAATTGNVATHITTADSGAVSFISLSNTGTSGKKYSLNVGGNTIGSGLSNNFFMYDNDNAQVRLLITPTGNVGIGTTSPSAKLEISDGTIILQSDLVAGGAYFGTKSNHPLVLFTNNTEKMRLTTAGKVGINTTTPANRLSILVNSSETEGLSLSDTSTTTSVFTYNTSTGENKIGGVASYAFPTFYSGSTERMRITTAGNVGIGTASPSAKIHIDGSDTSFSALQIINNTNTGTSGNYSFTEWQSNNGINKLRIGIYNTNDGKDAFILNAAGSNIRFESGTGAGAEKMRITSTGYLLIGYSSSNGSYPLQVNGQIFATSSTIATSDQRYKENIVPLTGALDLVNALNPVQFDWKQHAVHNFNTAQPTVGFLAQEVAEVLKDQPYLNSVVKKSECTWETETGEFVDVTKQVEVDGELVDEIVQEAVKETHTEEFYGIAESNLIAILTKAVQELSAKVTALEAQISLK